MEQDVIREPQRTKLEVQLTAWQQELVNLTRRNKLLYFKHTRSSSLELERPDVQKIWQGLDTSGWRFFESADLGLEASEPELAPDQLLANKTRREELQRTLRGLERATNQAQLDTGLHILYVAFGMLRWTDPGETTLNESPLLLRPVVFDNRTSLLAPFRLRAAPEDSVLNPAIAIKLAQDYGIDLPSLEDVGEDPSNVIDAVAAAVRRQRNWSVEPRAVLTTFTFHKEAMYRDLVDNAGLVMESPLVQAIAIGPSAPSASEFSFDPPREDVLDTIAPSESLVSVRDADSTQRACIVAAASGRSFVMDGPPGTGKSQTITNIIAELLHAGKSVLFVSEKAAALEVVHNRLKEAGLDEYALELHSHKATRKEFAAALGRALTTRPRASRAFDPTEESALARLRTELNSYASALNERRMPLRQSVHQVIGRITTLQHLPHAPVCGLAGEDLTPEDLNFIVEKAEQLGRAWGPVLLGREFLWRGLRDTSLSGNRLQQIEYLLQAVRQAIDALVARLEELNHETGLGLTGDLASAERIQEVLQAVEGRPSDAVLSDWLAVDDLKPTTDLFVRCRALAQERRLAEETAARTHRGWIDVDPDAAVTLDDLLARLVHGTHTVRAPSDARSSWFGQAAEAVDDVANLTRQLLDDSHTIASILGLPADGVTVARVSELADAGVLVAANDRPERSWINPVTLTALTEAESVLSALVGEYRRMRDEMTSVFKESILEVDLQGLQARLKANGGLKKLGSTYRASKKLLAEHCTSGKVTDEARAQLDRAAAWQQLSERLSEAEQRHAGVLGRYYPGRSSVDFSRVERALGVARRALEISGGLAPAPLVDQLDVDAQPDPALVIAGQRLRDNLPKWEAAVGRLTQMGAVIDVADSIGSIIEWAEHAGATLREIERVISAVGGSVEELLLADAREMLHAAARYHQVTVELTELHDAAARFLGPTYQGPGTDWDSLERHLAWALQVRDAIGGPCQPIVADALLSMPPTANGLRQLIDRLIKDWGELANLFEPDQQEYLDTEFRVSLSDARALIDELAAKVGQVDEWVRYRSARDALTELGLTPAIEFAERACLPAEAVAGVLERSVLEGWVDRVVASDARLSTLAPTERSKVVERFQELDRKQVALASAKVIDACNARRPSTVVGVAGIICREAEKKTRHMPIRTLLSQVREVALALKPCFMMSPLSVSQFLPPDIRFDVVIFDEASQVKPSEAVNCVYRGHQLIVAGDPKQLPPTSFFDAMASASEEYEEEAPEDFESVLDACRSSGLPTLSLRWHYRSQHESLITYSNYRFYEGRLHTFPGAHEHGDDIGVALFKVDGVYRRGAARDNPVEADAVVDRVLYHRQANPDLSLGVIAFSIAQEAAIAAAFERRASDHPELNELLSTDRLDGFFVKNLENVQGDERDIIVFSIGYGPDEVGKFTETLGPLNKAGGERRLNVAITRARRRVEIVSSITGASFPGTSKAPGVRHLQRYLEFAERGMSALALDLGTDDRDVESPFEAEVARVISAMGFDPVPQVGVGGFRIDIGVRHPERPGEFVLGVECDGAAYHSSRVARDRDRLRQEVLEGLGWRLYRIWGPAWYRDRRGEEDALRAAIEAAIKGGRVRSRRAAPPTPLEVHVDDVEFAERPTWAVPYRLSPALGNGRLTRLNFTERGTRLEIMSTIEKVAEYEGPIHVELLRRRVSEAFGISRMGANIRAAYDDAFTATLKSGKLRLIDADFVATSDDAPAVRVPTEDPRTRRNVEEVPPAERRAAIRGLVADAHRVEQSDLLVAFARLFGWQRAGVDIRAAFEVDLAALLKSGAVVCDGPYVAAR